MARQKNVHRKHYVQAWEPGQDEPGEEWLRLANRIASISDDSNETTETEAFYDGDGTEEETITGIAEAYSPTGHYNPEDPAQELIASLKRKVGDGRKIWHRVVRSDGKKEWVGVATVSSIVAGAGDAQNYEEFSCTIRFNEIPKETDLSTPEG